MRLFFTSVTLLLALASGLPGAMLTYGDEDCFNQGCYNSSDPTMGATLEGLATNVVTLAGTVFTHLYPFSPSADFPGTDQIFVGSTQTGAHDGYSTDNARINGPAIFTLDYSSLVGPGLTVASLTLGIAADDFQFVSFGQPFTATINGVTNTAITGQLNAFDQSGPEVQLFTAGLDPALDNPNHIMTLAIDAGGDGGDGYAVDFLTIGVTTARLVGTAPESSTLPLAGLGVLLIAISRCRTPPSPRGEK